VGPLGREADASFNFSERGGLGVTINYAFSQGAFAGISLESAYLNTRSKENERFYGKPAKASEILFDNAVEIPKGKGVEEVSLARSRLAFRRVSLVVKRHLTHTCCVTFLVAPSALLVEGWKGNDSRACVADGSGRNRARSKGAVMCWNRIHDPTSRSSGFAECPTKCLISAISALDNRSSFGCPILPEVLSSLNRGIAIEVRVMYNYR
jgi:hypothetical protein